MPVTAAHDGNSLMFRDTPPAFPRYTSSPKRLKPAA